MSYAKDPRVDAYLEALPGWQREVCGRHGHIITGGHENKTARYVAGYWGEDLPAGPLAAMLT